MTCAPKVFRDREHEGNWRVEKLDDDGETMGLVLLT
jgi:hypothetical protein